MMSHLLTIGWQYSIQRNTTKSGMYIQSSNPVFLPVAHRSRNTWNGGVGGGGGSIRPQVLLKKGFVTNYLLFGKTSTFVVTINCSQLSAFTVRKPCGYN